ncbi:MAG: ribosomal-processing cysteine protease Prp [Lachnospiraceae bacterium]|nr:ribosomal-processing cysteine protease Prp [Lachnospiraceae bacterium]MDD7027135.1 ribosomal-processing cysteine protease Prp [Lachnospiraceae bacterium]MDY5700154.1 ribosomal-processing cysteine protease Prp [Lachnospiraceae bacterium]
MTHISVYRTKEGIYRGLTCIGHAGYAHAGEDIVCAAISVLVINTGNSLEQLAGVIPEAVINEEEGLMDLRWVADGNEKMQLLMDSLILGLTGIMKQYGKTYIDLAFKEV